jgi:hypothetical protein
MRRTIAKTPCQNNRGKEWKKKMAGKKHSMENHDWATGEYFNQPLP